MNKNIQFLFIILFVSISAALYAGGLNSTSILFEIGDISRIRKYIVCFVTLLIFIYCLYKLRILFIKDVWKEPVVLFKIIAIIVSFALYIMMFFIPYIFKNFSGSVLTSRSDNRNLCYSNIRKIQNAIERYNFENYDKVKYLNKKIVNKLIEKGYLKSMPECPGIYGFNKNGFCYKNLGDLTINGEISCGSYALGNNGSSLDDWNYHGTLTGHARTQFWNPSLNQYDKYSIYKK